MPAASRRVRWYWAGRPVLARLPHGLPSLLIGLVLGSSRPTDLHAINERWYADQLERYADAAYVDSGLFAWEDEALERSFPGTGSVLVAAAGAGRELVALHRRGYVPTGFECHAGLRARAAPALAAAGMETVVLPAPYDRCPPLPAGFDALVLGWSAYGFVSTRAARVGLLGELRALGGGPGTPLLVSFAARGALRPRDRLRTTTANLVRRVRRAAPVTLGDTLDPYYVHRFTAEEVAGELREAGFVPEVLDLAAGYAVGRVADAEALRRVSSA